MHGMSQRATQAASTALLPPSERTDRTHVKVGSADLRMTEIAEDEMDPYKTAKNEQAFVDIKKKS